MIDQLQPPPQKWYENSILIKLTVITLIILALLIPSSWIQNLVDEREDIQTKMGSAVSDSWSGSQLIQGPVLVIPYNKLPGAACNATGYIYLLPDDVHIKANLKTQPFKQGVFDVTVYTSATGVQGNFAQPNLAKLGITPGQVMYDKARLLFGIADIKGLLTNPLVKIQGQNYTPEPASSDVNPFVQSLQVEFPLPVNGNIAFNYNLDLKGSNDINFLHLGKTTDVQFKSDWPTPQYNGRYLPDTRDSTSNGSGAKWHRLYYNRPFPQQWLNDNSVLSNPKSIAEATFGVRLQPPVDEYRKVTRTNRYATLIILLTFVSLFLTELIRKQPIHLFNYTLIGAAMIVYYILLLSFAEKIGYNYAYLISSTATIGLISFFTASLLKNKGAAAMFALILSVFYGFIFIIIQLEEYSLLVGAVALFFIVAALMYFSRKINWDNH
ncbi:cell envelope integrity protein CreD [Mucilaginibacter psychrotolerans]|uniref:Cell envelope integrity protein CreD n=1 Tax=Mucilaginibacter psychrotolerans TaxID=1524096 RepID=A0A4Y8SH60_9SPHI|nr:cell envelope integrity protein CreD [Mucilaginibacter psychrotolerans]TFF38268.1 cell envelope integrity protein CreD [Mucilaginibacter psychrotolerans]